MRGTDVFETVTMELRSKHDEGYLLDLAKISGQYFEADRKIGKLQQE